MDNGFVYKNYDKYEKFLIFSRDIVRKCSILHGISFSKKANTNWTWYKVLLLAALKQPGVVTHTKVNWDGHPLKIDGNSLD